MNTPAVVATLALLAGCVSASSERFASLECNCQTSDTPRFRVFVQDRAESWSCSGHGAFHKVVSQYEITLPSEPGGDVTYLAAQLTVARMTGGEPRPLPLTAGTLILDLKGKKVVVSLQTPVGPAPFNGTFPLDDIRKWGFRRRA
jgi:hypothetical protein